MTTPNRNYNVPEAGEEDWHIPVNENWEDIDEDVEDSITRNGSIHNIVEYGAIPNDDSASAISTNNSAIQNAIDDATDGDVGGGTVYIPVGEWHYDSELDVAPVSQSIVGENRRHCVLTYHGSGTAMRITATWARYANFRVQSGSGASPDVGIWLDPNPSGSYAGRRSTFKNIEVRSFDEANWRMHYTWWLTFIDCWARHGSGRGFDVGTEDHGQAQVNAVSFLNCRATGCGEEGWFLGNVNAVSLFGGGSEGCDGPGIHANIGSMNNRGLRIIGTYHEHNDEDGDWDPFLPRSQILLRGSTGAVIEPALVTASDGVGVHLKHAQHFRIGGGRWTGLDDAIMLGWGDDSDFALDGLIFPIYLDGTTNDVNADNTRRVTQHTGEYTEYHTNGGSTDGNRLYGGMYMGGSTPHTADGSGNLYFDGDNGTWVWDNPSNNDWETV